VLQTARRVKPVHIVQINQIMEKWRNEDADALDYEGHLRIEEVMETYMWIGICRKTF